MSEVIQPRRCMLLVPGSNARMLEKSATSAADVLMFDMDDAVVYEDAPKKTAQKLLAGSTSTHDFSSKEIVVRINAIDTPWWQDDIRAAVEAGIKLIMPPKADGPQQLLEVVRFLDSLPEADGVKLWPMIETTGAVLNSEAIASQVPRLMGFCFGIGDYTVSVGAHFVDIPDRVSYPLGHLVCVARHHGLVPFAPAVAFSDMGSDTIVREWGQYLARVGYEGALVIHPRHVPIINEVFTPSRATIDAALEMNKAIAEARAQGRAAVIIGGKLIEKVNIDIAQRTLAIARKLGLVSEEVGA
jgi:citrate lyase subunit beta/citryl-CoA lyase